MNILELEKQSTKKFHPQVANHFNHELTKGLLAVQAEVSPKYLYNLLGSKIFESICELPEYYPTRTEALIFEKDCNSIATSCGQGMTLIDLGAGNCKKASKLFHSLRPEKYIPVDISADFLQESVNNLKLQYPHINMIPLEMDLSTQIKIPDWVNAENRLFFYPGSSIGNFAPTEALHLLSQIHQACGSNSGLLIGVDLIKDNEVLQQAYNDGLGVTSAFNLNILLNLNSQIEANFDLKDWQHFAIFNRLQSRIEMHLKARRPIRVRWNNGHRDFRKGETIHTENSYKYTTSNFLQILKKAGFQNFSCWFDPNKWFMVCYAQSASSKEWN